MTTPKGGSTTTTTAKQEVPAYVQTAQQNLLNQSNNILSPFLQQQQFTQAGLNADQTGAYDLTRALAQSAFSGSGAAQTSANRPAPPTSPDLIDFRNERGLWQAPADIAQATTRDVTAQGYAPQATTSQGYAASGYDPRNATAQGYDVRGYDARNTTAQGYDTVGSTAAQVTGDEIQGMLNPYTQSVVDTTLQQMGRTRDEAVAKNAARSAAAGSFGGSRQALQSAQLDRSFGEQAAQTTATLMSAGFDRATATALANTGMRQQTGQVNQQAANTAAQFNAGAQNTANLSNQAAQNTAQQFNAGAFNTAGRYNAGAQNTAGLTNAAAQNAAAQYLAGAQNTASQFGVGAQNAANLANQAAANTAGQFGAAAGNNASLANAGAANTASQFNASGRNARDQFNATTGANMLQNANANALSRYGADLSGYSAQNSNINAAAQLQEAIKSGDQNRQLQAIQALLANGNSQQQFAQSNVTTPLQYLQLLQQTTPQNYGGTNTTTAPNTAPSPLQSLLGAGLAIGSKFI